MEEISRGFPLLSSSPITQTEVGFGERVARLIEGEDVAQSENCA